MFPTDDDVFHGNAYEIIAWANNQDIVYYHEFGSYQGEWLLVSKTLSEYYIYKGWYGSCSGCDAFQSELDYGDIGIEKAKEFASEYEPFLVVPIDTMKNICEKGKLIEIIPANIREDVSEISFASAVADITVLVKITEDMEISASEILNMANAELQQRALSGFGYERFIYESNAEILHTNGDDKLFAVGNMRFVGVRDSSTSRQYILRVPPDIKRVTQGIAWTFDMTENQYKPLIET